MDSDLPEPSMAVLILHSWPTLLERTLLLLPLTLPLLPVLTLTLVRVSFEVELSVIYSCGGKL